MPAGFDAVIMVEVVHEVDESTIEILAPAPPYQHVRPLGEDIVATELVLPEGHRVRPIDLGACAAAGVTSVAVRKRPTVAIIPTGTELVQPGAELEPGDIVEFNGLVIAGMVREWGGEAARLAPVPDDKEAIAAAVRNAAREHDIVVVNAGSSAGSEDFTADVVQGPGRTAGARRGAEARPSGGAWRGGGQAGARHPGVPGLRRADDRAFREAADRGRAGPGGAAEGADAGSADAERSFADGGGRAAAGEAGARWGPGSSLRRCSEGRA